MMRYATAALIACITSAALAAETPALRSTVLVSGDLVRIGDLVENAAPGKAQIAIFRAPDLGETGSVAAASVMEALRPHNVIGVNANGVTEISVTRASRLVGANEIKARIAEIAAERLRLSDAGAIDVRFDVAPKAMHLDPGNTAPLSPLRIAYDNRSGRFDMTFKPDGAPALRLTGTAQEMQEAVVVTRAVNRGDILREGDVAVQKRPKPDIQSDTIREAAAAVGMMAQQALRAGQPLRGSDVSRPHLAKRGEAVVLLYEVPGIVLTARGKAEESGAEGETINVLNVQSKRVVQAVVTGPGQVTVTSLTPRLTTAAANHATIQQASASAAAGIKAE